MEEKMYTSIFHRSLFFDTPSLLPPPTRVWDAAELPTPNMVPSNVRCVETVG